MRRKTPEDAKMKTTRKTTLAEVRRLRAEAEKIDPATQFLPRAVLADWLDERGIDGAALRLPVRTHRFTVEGDFHGGSATLVADVVREEIDYEDEYSDEPVTFVVVLLSRSQIERANRKLCGIASCCCRDGFGPDDGSGEMYDGEEVAEHRVVMGAL